MVFLRELRIPLVHSKEELKFFCRVLKIKASPIIWCRPKHIEFQTPPCVSDIATPVVYQEFKDIVAFLATPIDRSLEILTVELVDSGQTLEHPFMSLGIDIDI